MQSVIDIFEPFFLQYNLRDKLLELFRLIFVAFPFENVIIAPGAEYITSAIRNSY